jgi:hypothetical protein
MCNGAAAEPDIHGDSPTLHDPAECKSTVGWLPRQDSGRVRAIVERPIRKFRVTSRAAFLVHEGEGKDQPFRIDDLTIFALHPEIAAFRQTVTEVKEAARAKIRIAEWDGATSRSKPARQTLRLRPGLEHEFARSIEDARKVLLPDSRSSCCRFCQISREAAECLAQALDSSELPDHPVAQGGGFEKHPLGDIRLAALFLKDCRHAERRAVPFYHCF